MNILKRTTFPAAFAAVIIALGSADAFAGRGAATVTVASAPHSVRHVETHSYDSTGGHSIHKTTRHSVAPVYGVGYSSGHSGGTVSVGVAYTSSAPVYYSGHTYSYSGHHSPHHARACDHRYYSRPRVGIHLSYGSGGHYGYGLHLSNRYGGSAHVNFRTGHRSKHHGGHGSGHHGGHRGGHGGGHGGGHHGGHGGGHHGGHH